MSITTHRRNKAIAIANKLIASVLNGRPTAEGLERLSSKVAGFSDAQWGLVAEAADPKWRGKASDGLLGASERTRNAVLRHLLHRANAKRTQAARSTLRRVGAELRGEA